MGPLFPPSLLHCVTQRGTKDKFFKVAMPPLGVFIDDKVINSRGIPHDKFHPFHTRGRRGEWADSHYNLLPGWWAIVRVADELKRVWLATGKSPFGCVGCSCA